MNKEILDEEYPLTPDQIEFYKENAFIKLKNVFPAEVIKAFNTIITKKVHALNEVAVPIDERDTYGKAFLQLFNLWLEDEDIKTLVFSKRLARLAAALMQVDGVRLYHDQALFKESGGGITPWHADQHYWPLASAKTTTVWIPLQHTPIAMGPLEFSAKSHTILSGRELSISDESETIISKKLNSLDFKQVVEPFDIGELSFHSGWVFHRAGANTHHETRKVMTIIYMDKDMILKTPKNSGQKNDWEKWCKGAKIGEVINTPLNPILFEKTTAKAS